MKKSILFFYILIVKTSYSNFIEVFSLEGNSSNFKKNFESKVDKKIETEIQRKENISEATQIKDDEQIKNIIEKNKITLITEEKIQEIIEFAKNSPLPENSVENKKEFIPVYKFDTTQSDFFIDIQKALDKYDFSDKSEEIYGGQITSKELTSDKIINNLEFGIGVAYKNHEYYDSKYENKNLDIWTHTPIYATGKYKMSDNSTNTKYLKINLGYAIGTFNDEEYIDKKKQSGIYYGIGAGIEYKILSFDLIYQVNKNAYKKNNSMQNDSRITFSIDYKFDS